MMERLTCDSPQTNTEHLLNFAYAKSGKVYLRWADGAEDVDLCDYIANNACCTEVDATEVMDGACLECDNRASALYKAAVQAAELRARLMAYEKTGLTPEEIDMDHEAAENLRRLCQLCDLDRLEELAQADKDGRLVVLPCRMGDMVYLIPEGYHHIKECVVRYICLGAGSHIVGYNMTTHGDYAAALGEVGRSVFLTREEAEQALKEAKEDG